MYSFQIIFKGDLKGLLYFENNLIEGAFNKKQTEILSVIASPLAISLENANLFNNLKASNEMLSKMLQKAINVISKIVELRDVYTSAHQKKVQQLSCAIAKEMGLPEDTINNISLGALIHDIGRIYIASEIFNKPGKISNLEYQLLQTHVTNGYEAVKEIYFPQPITDMIYQHHERLDGSGYLQRLIGDKITMESRILAVADVVEAMTSDRPYRAALGIDLALEEILLHKGTKYDADVVDVCKKLFQKQGFKFSS